MLSAFDVIAESKLERKTAPTNVPQKLATFLGSPMLVVVIRSLDCEHCVAQLNDLQKLAATTKDCPQIIVATFDSDLEKTSVPNQDSFPKLVIISDPIGDILHYLCKNPAGRLHAAAILNKEGEVVWEEVSRFPYQSFSELIKSQISPTQ